MAQPGFGMSITFNSSFFGEVTNISWGSVTRDPLETTHMTTTDGERTFIPSDLTDAGELTVQGWFDEDTEMPIQSATETVTVAFAVRSGNTSAATWAASGFLTAFDWDGPYDGLLSFTATIKFTAAITVTPGA